MSTEQNSAEQLSEKLNDFADAYHDWRDWIEHGYGNYYDQVFKEKQATYERLRGELLAAATPPAAAPAPSKDTWVCGTGIATPPELQHQHSQNMKPAAPAPAVPSGEVMMTGDSVLPKGIQWKLVQTPITEEMHAVAVKALTRASGLDSLPQRMLDAMLAATPSAPAQEQWETSPKDGEQWETTPKPVTLTDDEICECFGIDGADDWVFKGARAIIAALREKEQSK